MSPGTANVKPHRARSDAGRLNRPIRSRHANVASRGLANQTRFERPQVDIVIVPAYELFIFADFWVINMIEFFTGSNPIGNNVTYQPTEDGSMLAIGDNGEQIKFTAVDDNRMIVERDGVVLGEVAFDANKQVTMTNYANADVQTLDLSNVPAM